VSRHVQTATVARSLSPQRMTGRLLLGFQRAASNGENLFDAFGTSDAGIGQ
jgi:hypothetical protein